MSEFRLAYSNLACPGWSIEHAAGEAKRLGYDAIELRLLKGEVIDPERDRAALGEAVDLCRAEGIEVCAFDTSCLLNVATEERARQLATLRQWIDRAHELDVPILRVFGGPDEPGSSDEEAIGRVADALSHIAPEAEEAGCTVALETHDAFASARRVAQVLDRAPSPAMAALWDSHHPYRVGETADEVGILLDGRLAHVHVKDARRSGEDAWELVLLGDGDVPVIQQLRVLERLDYNGYVSVEWEKRWHREIAEPEVALPQHIAQLRRWMATI